MNSNYILKADMLDIIFDNRNKSYGAYDLRKSYRRRLYKALGVMITFVLILSAFTFLPKGKISLAPVIHDSTTLVAIKEDLPKEKPVEPKQQAEPLRPKQPPVESQKFVANIEITKKPQEADKLSNNLDSAMIASLTNHLPGGTTQPVIPVGVSSPGNGSGESKTPTDVIDRETPRPAADIMPEFPGGMPALKKFLERNLQNPNDVEGGGENVSVKVKFIVGYDGKLKGFETVQDGGKAFNNEVVRVLKKMPDWNPGKANGQNVSVYYVIPVQFRATE